MEQHDEMPQRSLSRGSHGPAGAMEWRADD